MKILIVTDAWDPQVNGVVRTLKNTRRELIAMGHEVKIISPQLFKTIPCPTYPEIRLSLFPRKKFKKIIKSWNPDALHIATEGPLGIAARAYAKYHHFPYTTAYHTRFPEYIKARAGIPLSLTYIFLRWFHKYSHAILVPTRSVQEDLTRWGFKNVVIWSRGVDLDKFTPTPRYGKEGKRPIFLYVGRVAVEKNIEAFLKLDLPGSKWVAGDGPLLETLKYRYPDARYLGVLMQPELAHLYREADVFVFPSKTDTFGLVLLEALACGTPIAAYPVTGPIDVLENSDAGVLDNNLAHACKKALFISREVARAHAEKFSWRICTEQFFSYLCPIEKEQNAGKIIALPSQQI